MSLCPWLFVWLTQMFFQIHAALSEWRTGVHKPMAFSADSFADAYNEHITLLTGIKNKNVRAYHAMMHRLYREATYVPPQSLLVLAQRVLTMISTAESQLLLLPPPLRAVRRSIRSTSPTWTWTSSPTTASHGMFDHRLLVKVSVLPRFRRHSAEANVLISCYRNLHSLFPSLDFIHL